MVTVEDSGIDLEAVLNEMKVKGIKARLGRTADSLEKRWQGFHGKSHEALLDVTLAIDPKSIADLNVLLKEKGLQIIPAEGSIFSGLKRTVGAAEYKLTSL